MLDPATLLVTWLNTLQKSNAVNGFQQSEQAKNIENMFIPIY
jgi:hypothetical protein